MHQSAISQVHPRQPLPYAIDRIEPFSTPSEREHTILNIDIDKAASVAGAFALLLVLISATLQVVDFYTGYNSLLVHKLVKLFYVDLEVNVPTFFSVAVLLAAASLLSVITYLKKKFDEPYVFIWGLLSGGFTFMALDEMASIHERMIEPVRAMLGITAHGLFYYAWVIPAVGMLCPLAAIFPKFLAHLPRNVRILCIVGGAMFVTGAVGLEMVEGILEPETLGYEVLVHAEELLEMTGVILFIWTLTGYVRDQYGEIRLPLQKPEKKSERFTPDLSVELVG